MYVSSNYITSLTCILLSEISLKLLPIWPGYLFNVISGVQCLNEVKVEIVINAFISQRKHDLKFQAGLLLEPI